MSIARWGANLPDVESFGVAYWGDPLGVRGDAAAADGQDGPGFWFGALSLPADAAKRYRAVVTRWPVPGQLVVHGDDGAFSYTGPTDFALYRLWEDDALLPVDIGFGPGVGRVDFAIGTVAGGALLATVRGDPVGPAGLFAMPASAASLMGALSLSPARPSGLLRISAPVVIGPITRRPKTVTLSPRLRRIGPLRWQIGAVPEPGDPVLVVPRMDFTQPANSQYIPTIAN